MPRLGIIALLASILVGCAKQPELHRSMAAEFVLGRTTRQEALARLGPPTATTTSTVRVDGSGEGQAVTLLAWSHRDFGNVLLSDWIPERWLALAFAGDRLVATEYSSSNPADPTEFEPERAAGLRIGIDDSRTVIAALGPPSGSAIPPMVSPPAVRVLIWTWGINNRYTGASRMRVASASFDARDRLVTINADGGETPGVTPRTITVPIFIPRGR